MDDIEQFIHDFIVEQVGEDLGPGIDLQAREMRERLEPLLGALSYEKGWGNSDNFMAPGDAPEKIFQYRRAVRRGPWLPVER
jgi:hypothetical protein